MGFLKDQTMIIHVTCSVQLGLQLTTGLIIRAPKDSAASVGATEKGRKDLGQA